ncbi:hypothetical protein EXIGLDRAFT_615820 [Exidia glandulosa HHB12029]|uniref:Small ribosomal subunit protein mS23 n=1 Tax=Exidia glandulosa HHB12029 TaxID=1314781 RepID=A0A165H1U3_EXIGL|nr:hypothetical protein EXIGLDRAFT_615820 [Exidia glandulosa HHB12029]
MPRRFAAQVHQTTSRLLEAKHIRRAPAWYHVVLEHPPVPLPPRAPPNRAQFDVRPNSAPKDAPRRMGAPNVRPLPVYYLEDEIRRQFFKDHPFEAFRPRSLHEKGLIDDEHPIRGEAWTRLRQRGRHPSAEDCVLFALNLHVAHGQPLSDAYELAVTQFRALRSEAHIASATARLEAQAYGARFTEPTAVEKSFQREEDNMRSWDLQTELDSGALAARKRWKMIIERKQDAEFSRGEAYVALWKKGELPDYLPASATPHIQGRPMLDQAVAETEPQDAPPVF